MKKYICLFVLATMMTGCCALLDDGSDDSYDGGFHDAVVVDAETLDEVTVPGYVAIDGRPWDWSSAQVLIHGDSTYCSFSSNKPLHDGEAIHFSDAYAGAAPGDITASHGVTMTGYSLDDPGNEVTLYCAKAYSSLDDTDVSIGMSNILNFSSQ